MTSRFSAALAATAVLLVLVPGGVVGGPAACAADEADTFAVAVDFGDAQGAPSSTVTCVPVDGDDTAADALATRARMLGRPAPTYNNAGLLCSIDGFPQSGCGERTATGYRYWSYWFGGEDWTFATTGPAFHRAKPSGAVGWRFQPSGAGNAADPPPRFPSSHVQMCPAAARATATTSPPTTTPPAATPPAATPTTAAPVPAVTTAPPITASTAEEASPSTTAQNDVERDGADRQAAEEASSPERDKSEGGSAAPAAGAVLLLAGGIGTGAALRARRR